jgi:hypothetical protein
MYQADRHGALANGRGHPLDRSVANIARREDARPCGLQQHRRPPQASLPAVAHPPGGKARAEQLVADARQAVKEHAPLDRVRSLTTSHSACWSRRRRGPVSCGSFRPSSLSRPGSSACAPASH